MIERHYGALLDGAGPESVAALGSLEAELEAKTRGRSRCRGAVVSDLCGKEGVTYWLFSLCP
jgi:hypothetical protein